MQKNVNVVASVFPTFTYDLKIVRIQSYPCLCKLVHIFGRSTLRMPGFVGLGNQKVKAF